MALTLIIQLLTLLLISFLSAAAALGVFARITARARLGRAGFMETPDRSTTFLFDEDRLVDASPEAKQLFKTSPLADSDWDRVEMLFRGSYPNLNADIATLPEQGHLALSSEDMQSSLILEWHNGLTKLTVKDADPNVPTAAIDHHSLTAMEQELETLRAVAGAAPFLVWRQRTDRTILWANTAYLELAAQSDPDADVPVWPPARLFATPVQPATGAPTATRLTVHIPGETDPRWFECIATPVGQDHLFTAMSADKTVKAEVSLRDFVQTLTKTFAHLQIGLAIFDKQRRLALFNPALTDLTSLPTEFLLRQPTLHTVLDKLREKRMVPEQRDYRSWRQRLSDVEAAAKNGTYEETWSLPTGQTYRVTGQPHPDGALAFLMEDISAEISLTRRFKLELETSQAVFDSLDDAMVVFSTSGILTLSNSAYARLWGVDPDESLGNGDIVAATKTWTEKCAPTPVWGDLRSFVNQMGDRAEWAADVRLCDGRNLGCRFLPISGGSTLVEFSFAPPQIRQKSKPQVVPVPMILDSVPG